MSDAALRRMTSIGRTSSVDEDLVGGSGGPVSSGRDTMTVGGTVQRMGILMALLLITFTVGWTQASSDDPAGIMPWAIGASLLGTVLSFVISFKPHLASVLAPVFAAVEGIFLGVISALFESAYPGIVAQAAFGTLGVFFGMWALYSLRILRVTERMRSIVQLAMFGIFTTYMVSFVMSLFGARMPFIHDASPIGIAFSIIVIIVAAFMLLTDFDFIERGAAAGAPKQMEWYGAFAMLVSLIWLYVEMLRLLAKLRSR